MSGSKPRPAAEIARLRAALIGAADWCETMAERHKLPNQNELFWRGTRYAMQEAAAHFRELSDAANSSAKGCRTAAQTDARAARHPKDHSQ